MVVGQGQIQNFKGHSADKPFLSSQFRGQISPSFGINVSAANLFFAILISLTLRYTATHPILLLAILLLPTQMYYATFKDILSVLSTG